MYKWPLGTWLALAGFAAGVLGRAIFDFGWALPVWLAVLAAMVWLAPLALPSLLPARTPAAWSLILILAAAAGFWRAAVAYQETGLEWRPYLGETVKFTGLVVTEPDERLDHQRLSVRPRGQSFNVLLVAPREPKFRYGDEVSVRGLLEQPENFLTETGREFNYRGYLAKDDIFYLVRRPALGLVSSGNGHWVKERLLAAKAWFLESLDRRLPEPHSSLAAGLTVGARRGLSADWQEKLRQTGVIHIVVLSGYNLTIVAETLIRLFAFLPGWWRLALGGAGIVLFAVMTGAGASVVRATLMALIALIARLTGRVYHATTALGAAAFLMILFEPKILVFDVGFQLSVLATLGLIQGGPRLIRFFSWLPARGGLRELAAATASTQIFVLPWLLYQIGELSLVALPVNLLVVGAVPATMLFTFLAGAASGLTQWLAWPLAGAAYLLLAYELTVVEWFARLPFVAVTVESFPWTAVVLAYAGLIWWWRRLSPAGGTFPRRPA